MKHNFNKFVTSFVTMFFLAGTLFAQTVYLTTTGGTSNYTSGGAAVVIDAGVTCSNGPFNGALVSINSNFRSTEDRLVYPAVLYGITGSYNASTGVLTLSGAGTAAQYQDVLRSIEYQNISASPNTATRSITFQVGSALAYPGNGHYYQYVSSPGVHWDAAKTAAAATTYFGLQGYLVTITSSGENNFITQKIAGNTWTGGTCDPAFIAGAVWPGTWKWATGPELGTTFVSSFVPVGGRYNNWTPGEPNNFGRTEAYMHLYSNTGQWNDFAIDNINIAGYLIEYGGMGGDPAITVSGNQSVAILVPPPAPVNGAGSSVTTTSFSTNWTASSGATGYYLDVATDNTFSTYVIGFQNKDVANVTTYPLTGLSSGTYYYVRVRAYNSGGTSGNSGTTTVLTIPGAPTPAATPATSITTTSFNANWIASTGNGIGGYYLDVATDAGFSSLVAGYNGKDVGNVTTSSVTGLASGTNYYWRLRAYNTSGTSTNSSSTQTVTLPAAPTLPATPATSITTTSFSTNWNASSGNAVTGYYLDVATDAAFTSMVAGFSNLNVGNVTTYSVTGLTAGTNYYWRVRANDATGQSASSTTTFTSTVPLAPTFTTPPPPYAPASNVTVTSFSANWIASSGNGVSGYYLDVATDAGFTTLVAGFNNLNVGNVTTYSVTGLTPGINYYWRLRAYSSGGTSTNSSSILTVSLPLPPTFSIPPAPAISKTQTTFMAVWNASVGATGYYIDVALDGLFTNILPSFNNKDIGNVTQFNVTGLSPGQYYYYRLRAYNGSGTSSNSMIEAVMTTTYAPSPITATNITSTGFTGNWAVSTGATGYYLDVATDAAFTNLVAGYNRRDVLNVLSYNVTGLLPSTLYYVRVISHNAINDQADFTGVINVTTAVASPDSPNPPVTNVTSVSFTANWNAVPGATGYYFDLSTDPNFASFVSTFNNKDVGNVTTTTVTGLTPNTPYYFRVRAYGPGGTGNNSTTVPATTAPAAPTLANPSVTNVTSVSFTANWNSVLGANGYYFDLATDAGFTNIVSGYNNKDVGNVTTYTVTGLSANTQYYFRVRAYGNNGTGSNSVTGPATTSPATPTLANPSVTNITPVSFTANWNAVTGATGYYFDLSTDPNFASFVSNFNNKDVGNVTTYTVTGLAPNTQYYFRVRAYGPNGSSGNSNSGGAATLLNVAAILINIEPAPLQYTTMQTSLQVSNTIEVRDNIHATLASATVSVASNYNSTQDVLVFTDQNGITGRWDAVSGSMFLKGNASPAMYQTALRSVQYKNTSNKPTVIDRTISYTVNDGFDNSNLQSRTIKFALTGVEDLSLGVPTEYSLNQNYPNPFNPSTKIRFALPKESQVTLKVYNILGEEVAKLVDQVVPAGYHAYTFDATKLASGIYIYRLEAGNYVDVKKMLLMK